MERKLSKRKMLRRKYKHYAAALAGAAIMTGVALPGIPVAKTFAAESPTTTPPTITEKTVVTNNEQRVVTADKSHPLRLKNNYGWHQHEHSWPGTNDNHALYKDGKLYYHNDNHYWDNDRYYAHYNNSPVSFTKALASRYGFDQYRDSFRLLFQSNNQATVQVLKHETGQRFKVDLERDRDGDWRVVAIRGIGDSYHPATYHSFGRS